MPQVDYHRPVIESMLAGLAGSNPAAYDERLEAFNALCDKYGVPRFDRVVVTTVVEPTPPLVTEPTPLVTEPPLADPVLTTPVDVPATTVEVPVKAVKVKEPKKARTSKKKSSPSA